MPFVIAIDGPAASGKGTLARKLAERYAFQHLDTGLLYRGTAAALLDAGKSLDDESIAEEAARALDLAALDREVLSAHGVGDAASRVAAMPAVRQALLEVQRAFANQEPGAVLDGRDIATVICPNANVKLFITATPEVRAERRHKEALGRGDDIAFETILDDIKRRDERDQRRAEAPLIASGDADLIDTSKMDIETAFQTACDIVERSR